MFESTKTPDLKKSRFEMIKSIDADYYGFRDEDDGVLVPIEAEIEKRRKRYYTGLFNLIFTYVLLYVCRI